MAASKAAEQKIASSLQLKKQAVKLPMSSRLAVYQQEPQKLSAGQQRLSMRAAKPWTSCTSHVAQNWAMHKMHVHLPGKELLGP